MQTHLHLIVQGKKPDSDCLKMIVLFKQKTGFWLNKHKPGFKWQKDYYDHIIRNDKDLANQIYYILNNPVRAGIVNDWRDYKYKGSTLYDLNKIE
jgi:putative transposase